MSLGASMMRKRRFFHSTSDVLALKAAIPPTQCCRKSVHRPVVAETVHGTASARSLALARHEVSGRDSNTEIPDFSLYSNDCFKDIRVRRLSGLTQSSTLTPFARPKYYHPTLDPLQSESRRPKNPMRLLALALVVALAAVAKAFAPARPVGLLQARR